MSAQEPILTKKQKLISRLVMGAAVLLCGLFLLLCGVNAIPLQVKKVILPAVLTTLGVVCFVWAFIQDNTLLLWISMPLIFAGAVSVLSTYTASGYGFYYPLYILSPAIGSFVTAIYSGEWKDHLPVIIFFLLSAVIFALNAMLKVSWAVVIPLFILLLGLSIIFYTIFRRKE